MNLEQLLIILMLFFMGNAYVFTMIGIALKRIGYDVGVSIFIFLAFASYVTSLPIG